MEIHKNSSVISGFRRDVCENCVVVSYYAASSDNFSPIGFPAMTVRNNHCCMGNNKIGLAYHEIRVEQPEVRGHSVALNINWKIILKIFFNK